MSYLVNRQMLSVVEPVSSLSNTFSTGDPSMVLEAG